jgi:hypothetical protein
MDMKRFFQPHSARILLALGTISSWALVLGAGRKWD